MTHVGRLAPSPTGLLHLGHARSFLLAWLHTKSQGGSVRLRMEDLDEERSSGEFERAALQDLQWLGLDWTGPVIRQSEHLARFHTVLEDLLETGRAYPCVCSRRQLRAALSAPHGDSQPSRPYPGTCRHRYASVAEAERATGRAAGIRFLVKDGLIPFHDEVHGKQCFDVASMVGDFLIGRRNQSPAYQLAVVVDDAADLVTDIVRGDDLLESTAQQILLQRALGLPHPRWFHIPLLLDDQGVRIAKRADPLSLSQLREGGVDARRIVSWAAQSVGLSAPELVRPAELIEGFDLRSVRRKATRLQEPALHGLLR